MKGRYLLQCTLTGPGSSPFKRFGRFLSHGIGCLWPSQPCVAWDNLDMQDCHCLMSFYKKDMPSLVPAPRRAGWEYLTAWHWHLKSRLASKSAVFMSRLGMQWCDGYPHCPIVPGMLRSPQSTFLWGAGNAERADQECAFLPLSVPTMAIPLPICLRLHVSIFLVPP